MEQGSRSDSTVMSARQAEADHAPAIERMLAGSCEAQPASAPVAAASAPQDPGPAPADLAAACEWDIRHSAWFNSADERDEWTEAQNEAELAKSAAVWERAIAEPACDLATLAAKARMLRRDWLSGQPEAETDGDSQERLSLSIARDVIALAGLARTGSATPDAVTGDDPIFAVIEEAKRLAARQAALYEKCGHRPDSRPSWKPHNKAHAAMWDYIRGTLLKTVPTTAGGCKALACFTIEFTKEQGVPLCGETENNDPVLALIARSPAMDGAALGDPARAASPTAGGTASSVAAMLTDRPEPDRSIRRLDLTPEFRDLSCQLGDLVGFARIAQLVHDEVLCQKVKDAGLLGYLNLALTDDQVETFSWVSSQLVHVAGLAQQACERMEVLLMEQNDDVRERRAREGRS